MRRLGKDSGDRVPIVASALQCATTVKILVAAIALIVVLAAAVPPARAQETASGEAQKQKAIPGHEQTTRLSILEFAAGVESIISESLIPAERTRSESA